MLQCFISIIKTHSEVYNVALRPYSYFVQSMPKYKEGNEKMKQNN